MENTENNSSAESNQSAFLPVLIVFVTFTVLNLVQLYGILQARTRLAANYTQLTPVVGRAQQVAGVLEKVSRDVLSLAPTNANAEKIRKEFGIQDNAAAASPAAAPSSDAAPASKP
jgi:hypothetical protein